VTDAVRRLRAAANGQHGAFSAEQARESGVPDRVLRGWVASSLLERTGVRTYRAATAPPSSWTDLSALVLDVRPEMWFSFETAGALTGLEGCTLAPPYHATVRRGTLFRRPGVVVHTSKAIEDEDVTVAQGYPVTTPTRTIIDLAYQLTRRQLTTVIDGALRDRLTTETQLFERIEALRTSGRYAMPKLVAVLEGAEPTRGGHSWLERRFLELASARGLPRPSVQHDVGRVDGRTIRVDCRYPGTPVVVELLGHRWHRSKAQMQRDADRMNQMLADGLVPLQLTYDDLAVRPDRSIDVVDSVLRRYL